MAYVHGSRHARLGNCAAFCAGVALLGGMCTAQDLGNFAVYQTGIIEPNYLASPPGEPERVLIASMRGVLHVVENGVRLPTPFLDIRPRVSTSHGLIGVAFPPDYATSRRFYVNYTSLESGGPRIARYTTSADPNVANMTEEVLLDLGVAAGDHNAGWMEFGRDGYLYLTWGDWGGGPQFASNLQGKLIRIDVSPEVGYVSPPDNPYVGIDGMDEIVAIGLRNPWRNGFDRLTGDLYLADVGNNALEEINYVPYGTVVGRNFGWPCMEGTNCVPFPECTCLTPPMTLPIHEYTHQEGFAVIGGTVYRGSAIPRWRGRYFFMDAFTRKVWSFRAVDGVRVDLREHSADLNNGLPAGQGLNFGITIGSDGAGELYFLELGGRILKIMPAHVRADWNLDGVVNSADFFAFLADFFGGNADVTGDHVTGSPDFFEYLTYFFGD